MKWASGKRPVFMSLIVISLIAAIGFYTAQHLKDKQLQHSENKGDISKVVSEKTSDVVSVSAEELMSHYRRDAYGANKKYSDDSIQFGVPRIVPPPGHVPKSIIVKGKIKRIDKKDLSHIGFVNQYKTTVVLWGEDSTPHIAERKEKIATIEDETKDISNSLDQLAERLIREHDIVLNGDEVRCSFSRDQTYSLRHLNTDDFVEIRGNVVSHSLGKYGYIWYHLTLENCVLLDHSSTGEKDDASISTD